MRTWVDASTIIALDVVGETELLRDLLGKVSVTHEVAEEVYIGRESSGLRRARGEWIEVRAVRGDLRPWMDLGLARGEASLFLTPRTDRLVLDDAPARTVAESEGRDYVGLLGLILEGVRRRIVPGERAIDLLQRLLRSGFRLSPELYEETVRGVGFASGKGRD